MAKTKLAALLAWLICTSLATAQDMRPIQEIIEIQPSQAFIRCAGLYSAVAAWAGQDALGPETMATTESAMQINLANATLFYERTGIGANQDEALRMVMRDTNSAYELYIERFSRNTAAVGEAFGQDRMVRSDLNLCSEITERFRQ